MAHGHALLHEMQMLWTQSRCGTQKMPHHVLVLCATACLLEMVELVEAMV
jgi:ribosomal protein L32